MNVEAHRPMFGESGYERAALDAYWTPEWCTSVLLDSVKFRGRVWEPASGQGHICRVLSGRSYDVFATDIADHGYHDRLHDFLSRDTFVIPDGIESIVTNPPYEKAEKFIRTSLLLMRESRGQVAMLLRNEYDCARTRVDLFDAPPFVMKLVLTKRPRWSADEKASPRHNFAWYVWDWKHHGSPFLRYQGRST